MKLSLMTSDQAADALIQLAPEIEILVNDEGLAELIKTRELTSDKQKAKKLGAMFVFRVATYLLKNQRQTAWNIIGILDGKSPKEVGEQLFPVTIKQLMDILGDKDFMGFFRL